jgi:hypothetical protein
MLEDAGARHAGLIDGDIIVKYGDQKISNAVEFQKAFRERPPSPGLVLTFVRLLGDGSFVQGTATLMEASLGVSVMPI